MTELIPEGLVPFIMIPSIIALGVIITFVVARLTAKKLEPLKHSLGGEVVTSFLRGPYLRLQREGVETRVGIRSGGQNRPPSLYIRQMSPLGFDLTVSKENIVTRKLGDMGVLKDLKTGDPLFDDNYYIRSSDAMRAQTYLQDTGRRELIKGFFDAGFAVLRADKDSLSLRKEGYQSEDLEAGRIGSHIEGLRKLVTGV